MLQDAYETIDAKTDISNDQNNMLLKGKLKFKHNYLQIMAVIKSIEK